MGIILTLTSPQFFLSILKLAIFKLKYFETQIIGAGTVLGVSYLHYEPKSHVWLYFTISPTLC